MFFCLHSISRNKTQLEKKEEAKDSMLLNNPDSKEVYLFLLPDGTFRKFVATKPDDLFFDINHFRQSTDFQAFS